MENVSLVSYNLNFCDLIHFSPERFLMPFYLMFILFHFKWDMYIKSTSIGFPSYAP